MRNPTFLWTIVVIMLLLDIYVFQAVKLVLPTTSSRLRMFIVVSYWLIAVLMLGMLISFPYLNADAWPKQFRTYLFSLVVAAFFSKVIASLFLAADDIRRAGTWLIVRLFRTTSTELSRPAEGISRSVFISWLGIAFGGGLFTTFIYGFSNKYNYNVKKVKLAFNNLPSAFRGLKIVQISDVHSGSFTDIAAVRKGIDKIMKEKPDLIVFTGDLVNDRAVEMDDYIEVFGQLKAPMGVYSILGNHDYGDYYRWNSDQEKTDNLLQLKKVHEKMGWKLLMNEHVIFDRNNEQLALIGVENWSAKGNFPKYGKLSRAYTGAENIPFKILMSHDPSHWDGEVKTSYPSIDLMLAGHTHGMQFGVELPGFKWSPVQYMYKQWAGLYQDGAQKLYINRGFGFIGYPGRVGILPEISVITLT